MALNAYLELEAAGESAPILFGEDTTQHSLGGTDVSGWLECAEFEVALETGQGSATGRAPVRTKRTWRPARFMLRLGKSTPWIFEAARRNQRIDLTLHFFHRGAAGEITQHFDYRIRQGRVASLRIVQPNALLPTTANLHDYVELQVIPGVIEIESLTGSTMSTDTWLGSGA
jgi:type VI secretion system Hcp family effector